MATLPAATAAATESAAPLVSGATKPGSPTDLLLPGTLIVGVLLVGGTALTLRRSGTRLPNVLGGGGQTLRTGEDFAQGNPLVHLRTVHTTGSGGNGGDSGDSESQGTFAQGNPMVHIRKSVGDASAAEGSDIGTPNLTFTPANFSTPQTKPVVDINNKSDGASEVDEIQKSVGNVLIGDYQQLTDINVDQLGGDDSVARAFTTPPVAGDGSVARQGRDSLDLDAKAASPTGVHPVNDPPATDRPAGETMIHGDTLLLEAGRASLVPTSSVDLDAKSASLIGDPHETTGDGVASQRDRPSFDPKLADNNSPLPRDR